MIYDVIYSLLVLIRKLVDAVTKFNSKWKASRRTRTEVVTLPSSGQYDICTSMANASQDQIAQLTLKFQLAHFVVSKSKPSKLYTNFAESEHDVHNVKIGSGYLNTSSCIAGIYPSDFNVW